MGARVPVTGTQQVQLDLRHRGRLMDISLSGALLACDLTLPVGARAQLRTGFGMGPFVADLQVRRHQPPRPAQSTPAMLGATFIAMDAVSRRSLEVFLQRASE